MENNKILRFKKLSQVSGVSGDETEIKNILKDEYKPYVDFYHYDHLGSIFGVKKSVCNNENDKKTLMIACALDEIGLMVSEILSDGTLKFICLENLSATSLLHQSVKIKLRNNTEINGVISCSEIKILEEKCTSINEEKLIIDCGLTYNEINKIVTIGDLVSISGAFEILSENTIMAKTCNSRLFCEVGI